MSVSNISVEVSSVLQRLCELDYGKSATRKHQFVTVCCSIGPKSNDVNTMTKMIRAGMNIARFNMSHGTQEECAENIQSLYNAIEENNRTADVPVQVAIALDLNGPGIRTGMFPSQIDEVRLNEGDSIKLTSVESYAKQCSKDLIYINYPKLPFVVKPKTKIILDDGRLILKVDEIIGDVVNCTVKNTATLRSNTVVRFHNIPLQLPLLNDKDKSDIEFALEQDVDILIVSNTQNADHISKVRRLLGKKAHQIRVMAKINHIMSKKTIEDIIEISDGVVLSRGFFGIEIPLEQSFLFQKAIIEKCRRNTKPILCCGQFFASMINKPYPSHAEISDVASVILDGVDGIILLGETSLGKYPVHTVIELVNIIKEAENITWHRNVHENLASKQASIIDLFQAMVLTCTDVSIISKASAIINITVTGKTAISLSQHKPKCVIFAVTKSPKIAKKLVIYRSIYPILYKSGTSSKDWHEEIDKRVQIALLTGQKLGVIKPNDAVVIISEWRKSTSFTDTIRVIYACFNDEPVNN